MEHGEGKKWYLQAKNYSAEVFNKHLREAERGLFDWVANFEQRVIDEITELGEAGDDPSLLAEIEARQVQRAKKEHWGQFIPVEEQVQILDKAISIILFPCVCRSMIRGRTKDNYCMGTILDPALIGINKRISTYFPGEVDELTKEEAKKLVQKWDSEGVFHTVWTSGTPFIVNFCNCSARDCIPTQMRLHGQIGSSRLFKGEYVAEIDIEKCNGCRDCKLQCQFGAITHSISSQKCSVNQFLCVGCGLCRAVCPEEAITLVERSSIPALVNEW